MGHRDNKEFKKQQQPQHQEKQKLSSVKRSHILRMRFYSG